MPEGKRTVKDHGQPEVGDWIVVLSSGLMFTANNGSDWPDDTEWLPASAVVIPDHYAPVPRPPAFEVGGWVASLGTGLHYSVVDRERRQHEWWYSISDRPSPPFWRKESTLTKVDPPFPSSLSAVGWRPMSELEDGHERAAWILHGDRSIGYFTDTSRDDDVNTTLGVQRIAWQWVDGPNVPDDWSPDV